jgi:hypothetical protein
LAPDHRDKAANRLDSLPGGYDSATLTTQDIGAKNVYTFGHFITTTSTSFLL